MRAPQYAPARRRAQLGQSITGSTGGDIAVQAASTAIDTVAFAGIPVASFVSKIFGGLFGGGGLSHEQREQLELNKVIGVVRQMITQIRSATSLDDLWTKLVYWQSGSVGGASPVAVMVLVEDLPLETAVMLSQAGHIQWPGVNKSAASLTAEDVNAWLTSRSITPTWPRAIMIGNPNPTFPVLDRDSFYSLVLSGSDLSAHTQAGVTQGKLDPANTAVRNAIRNALQRLGAGGAQATSSGPDPAQVQAWVQQVYQALLGRAATAAEAAAPVPALASGQLTVDQFLTSLQRSPEFQARAQTTGAVPAGAGPPARLPQRVPPVEASVIPSLTGVPAWGWGLLAVAGLTGVLFLMPSTPAAPARAPRKAR